MNSFGSGKILKYTNSMISSIFRPVNKDLVDAKPAYLKNPAKTKLRDAFRIWGTVKEHIENATPWALYVGLVYPHAPFTVPAKY